MKKFWRSCRDKYLILYVGICSVVFPLFAFSASVPNLEHPSGKATELISFILNPENQPLLEMALREDLGEDDYIQFCIAQRKVGAISSLADQCLLPGGLPDANYQPLFPDNAALKAVYPYLRKEAKVQLRWSEGDSLCYSPQDEEIAGACMLPGSYYRDGFQNRFKRQELSFMNVSNGTDFEGSGNGTILCCEPNPDSGDSSQATVAWAVTGVISAMLFLLISAVVTTIVCVKCNSSSQ